MRKHLTIIPLILWAFCGFAQNFSPLSESFEGIFPPQGWTNLHVSGTPQWSQTNTLEHCAGAQEGANYVMVGFGQNDNYLITPKLYPQIGDSIVFYMGIESPNYNIDNFTTVEVSTTGTAPADFTTVRNLTVADFTMGDNWYRFAVNLGGYAGQGIYVAFHNKVTASGMLAGGNVYLDNVSGPDMAVAGCTTPLNLAATNISTSSADLTWQSDANEYIVYIRAFGETEYSEQTNATLNPYDSTFQVNGLVPGTSYQWYVAAICNDTFNSPVAAFTTSCVPYEADILPYSTTFAECTSFGDLPNCWIRVEGSEFNNSGIYFPGAHSNSFYGYDWYTGDTIIRFTPEDSIRHWVAMPAVNTDIHLLRVRFMAKPYENIASYGRMEIGLLPNISDTANFEIVSTIEAVNLPSTDYVQYVVPFLNTTLSGNNRLVCFRCIGQSGSVWYLDNVTLEYIPLCDEPSGLQIDDVSATTADLSWVPGDSSQIHFTIHYKPQNASVWLTEEVTLTDSAHYQLTDLQHSTLYEAYVTAPCAPDQQSNLVTFTTDCMPFEADSLPYYMDFENVAEYELPLCWTRLAGHTEYSHSYPCAIEGSSAHEGGICIRFSGNQSDPNLLALPAMEENIQQLRIRFWMKPGGNMTPYGSMEIGVMPNLNDTSAFEAVSIITASQLSNSDYQLYKVSFQNTTLPGSGNHIVFRYANPMNTASGYAWYIDDVTVEYIPDCYEPEGLAITGVTATTATLTWSSEDNVPVASTVHFAVAGDTAWVHQAVPAAANFSATLAGLTPNTTYTAYVTADCAADMPSLPVTFTTECAGITMSSIPTTWDFENENPSGTLSRPLPACWKRFATTSAEAPYVYSNALYAHQGVKMLNFNSTEGYAILPPLDDSVPVNALQLSFFARSSTDENGTPFTSQFQAGVMTDPYDTATFTNVQSFSVTGGTYFPVEISFAGYAGQGRYLALRQLDNGNVNGYGFIDQVTLEYISDCERPYDLYADDLSVSSARLHWSSNAPQFSVYFKEEGTDNYTLSGTTTDTFMVISANSGSSYDWYVSANCADTILASIPSGFSTLCAPVSVSSLSPWTENFDAPGTAHQVPYCWIRLSSFVWNATETYPAIDDYYEENSQNLLMAGVNATNIIALPQFAQDLNTLRLYFSAKAATVTSNNLEVGVLSSLSDTSGFQVISTLHPQDYLAELDPLTPYIPFVMDLDTVPDLTGWIALRLRCNDTVMSQWHLDDFKVKPIPECSEPLNLTVSDITSSSVDLSWESDADTFDVYYQSVNEATPHLLPGVTLTNGVFTLSGLNTGTHYIWYVVAHCPGNDNSDASHTGGFFTACGDIATFPHLEDFEYGMECWTTESVTGDNGWMVVSDPQYAASGSSCAVFLYHPGNSARLTSPVFDFSGYENITLDYDLYIRPYNNVYDSVGVYYRTSSDAPWTYLRSHTDNMGTNTYISYSTPLPNTGNEYQVMFLGEGLDGNSIFLDNISVSGDSIHDAPDTCPVPTNLEQQIALRDAANITVCWVDHAGVSQWNLQYRRENSGEEWSTVTVTGAPCHEIVGLINGTVYEIRVQAICDEERLSEWSVILSAIASDNGIEDHPDGHILLFPNPASDYVEIRANGNELDITGIEVYDVYGKLIRTVVVADNNNSRQTRINVAGLAAGTYFARLHTHQGVVTKPFVKR